MGFCFSDGEMTKVRKKTNTTYLLLEHTFKQLHAPLYFYAVKFIPDSEIAKDLVQDAFLSLLHNSGKTDIGNVKAYLYRSVRNNCLNHIKHHSIAEQYAEQEKERIGREIAFYDTHQTLVEQEMLQKINAAIDSLPEPYKTPFKLSRIEELKTKEIAQQLNLPVRTVETRLYRALKILREKIDSQGIVLFLGFFSKKRTNF